MGKVNTAELTPGMKVAVDVLSAAGEVIVAANTLLTAEHITALTTEAIPDIEISGDLSLLDLEVELDPHLEQMHFVQKRLHKRFILTNLCSPFMRELYNIVVEWQVKERLPIPEPEQVTDDDEDSSAEDSDN